ncbi:MAG TPA: RsmF rRNA methyltransferase first C-terminal domain-containing protein [Chitinophagaceae bacterium]|nr:RsmF rRNA methyltransferase first C-terminal domain-containing protein [Chitinophagaceae bacterium]
MQLPEIFLDSLQNTKGFNKESFQEIHSSNDQITSVRINPLKKSQTPNPKSKIPWTEHGYYLNSRPSFTFDPLFHAGCYYVQEASSMFLEQALKQTVDLSASLKVLDLCAAPGGKSTHIQSLISKDSLLVSNEVIRARVNILRDNIIKWGCENVFVTNNDPKDFSRLKGYFDVIVVDAPCSGSGLFRRDPEAIQEWSLNNVALCSQRQQRILADVWPALKEGGMLIYSTCSYSKEEDENIINWLSQEFNCDIMQLMINSDWGIIESEGGFRFWPDKVKGEGFFLACIRKKDEEMNTKIRIEKNIGKINNSEKEVLKRWVIDEGRQFNRLQNKVYIWPESLVADFSFLQQQQLRVNYSGILVGELIRDKLVPDHALAMSLILNDSVERIELKYEQAISYLQRNDFELTNTTTGWKTVTYKGYMLGWINILPGRINNYYPKELRILKRN